MCQSWSPTVIQNRIFSLQFARQIRPILPWGNNSIRRLPACQGSRKTLTVRIPSTKSTHTAVVRAIPASLASVPIRWVEHLGRAIPLLARESSVPVTDIRIARRTEGTTIATDPADYIIRQRRVFNTTTAFAYEQTHIKSVHSSTWRRLYASLSRRRAFLTSRLFNLESCPGRKRPPAVLPPQPQKQRSSWSSL